MRIAVSSPIGYETLLETEKSLVMSNSSFFHCVCKGLVLQTCKNKGLFGKGSKGYTCRMQKSNMKINLRNRHNSSICFNQASYGKVL